MVDPIHPSTRRSTLEGPHGATHVRGPEAEAHTPRAGHTIRHAHGKTLKGGSGSSTLGLPHHRPKPRAAHKPKPHRHAGARHGPAARHRRSSAVKGARKPAAVHGHAKGDFHTLVKFAQAHGFHVTSTNHGHHNVGSAHYQGRAIDVRTRDKSPAQIAAFKQAARNAGFVVRDERSHPKGQKVWSGSHLHLEIPRR